MKPSLGIIRILLTAILLWQTPALFAAIQVTVNSTGTTNLADSEMTFPEAIRYVNEVQGATNFTVYEANGSYTSFVGLGRPLSVAEQALVTTIAGTNNLILFNIPGTGPFIITADSTCMLDYIDPIDGPIYTNCTGALFPPILATNVTVDGYSQPGASPNSNPILAPNNAVLKIVTDSSTSVNDKGESTFGITGDRVFLRGMSMLGGGDNCGIGRGAVGGGIQGCWIGVPPSGALADVNPPGIGVYAYNSGGSQVIGTDGDGVNDRNEFNIFVGCYEMAIGFESDNEGIDTTNCRVSGNFIGVLPDGQTTLPSGSLPAEGDGMELAGADDVIFGTDANGISDENERNVVTGLAASTSSRCEDIQAWGQVRNLKVMGNYFGVDINGVPTTVGNKRLFKAEQDGSTAQIGSDGDGVNDAMEANIIAKHSSYLVNFAGVNSVVTLRRNSVFANTSDLFGDRKYSYNSYVLGLSGGSPSVADLSPVVSNVTTRAELIGWVPVSGDDAVGRTNAEIHIYQAASASPPSGQAQGKKWLATYLDNGPEDMDTRTNYFRFNICSLAIPSTGAALTVQETVMDATHGGSSYFAAPVSLPDVSSALSISQAGSSVTLNWQMNGVLQTNTSLTSGTWGNAPGCSPKTLTVGPGPLFFRVAQ